MTTNDPTERKVLKNAGLSPDTILDHELIFDNKKYNETNAEFLLNKFIPRNLLENANITKLSLSYNDFTIEIENDGFIIINKEGNQIRPKHINDLYYWIKLIKQI